MGLKIKKSPLGAHTVVPLTQTVDVEEFAEKDGKEVHNHTYPVSVFGEPAMITVKTGLTKNLGEYNSLRVDVGISYPCSQSEIDSTFDFCSEWVSNKLDALIAE